MTFLAGVLLVILSLYGVMDLRDQGYKVHLRHLFLFTMIAFYFFIVQW